MCTRPNCLRLIPRPRPMIPRPRPRRSSTRPRRDRGEALMGLGTALRPRQHPCFCYILNVQILRLQITMLCDCERHIVERLLTFCCLKKHKNRNFAVIRLGSALIISTSAVIFWQLELQAHMSDSWLYCLRDCWSSVAWSDAWQCALRPQKQNTFPSVSIVSSRFQIRQWYVALGEVTTNVILKVQFWTTLKPLTSRWVIPHKVSTGEDDWWARESQGLSSEVASAAVSVQPSQCSQLCDGLQYG